MKRPQRFKEMLQRGLDRLRLQAARPNALLPLAVLGLLTGLLAGFVTLAFRLLVEGVQAGFLPGGLPENYEALPLWLRLCLPLVGGLLIGLLFRWASSGPYVLGVARVLENLSYHQGHHSKRGFVMQFVGAAIAIVSGHSVGREGPMVFLGASGGSLLGQLLALPNNSIRTMVGCGSAAAIAAAFNTPLAGVIFALEVVMMEYTLASFIPVMLAAASADAITIAVFGAAPAFTVPLLQPGALREMPLLLVLGLATGTAAAAFIWLNRLFALQGQRLAFWWRTTLAGLIVGLCALWVPEVMGIGYDTVNAVLLGELGLGALAALVLFKVLASAASGGLGIPGGTIGPSLFIGAMVGGLVGILARMLLPELGISPGLYALLGMGAMMGASLQAPLAGLTAMVELTHNPEIMMPGMLVIVVASLTASVLFKQESIFITMLKARGLDYQANPVLQTLRRVGVASIMNQRLVRIDHVQRREQAEKLLSGGPEWLLIDDGGQPAALMYAVDLARHIQGEEMQGAGEDIDLLKIPARRLQVVPVQLQANLQEALDALDQSAAEALYVERVTAPGISHVYGALTREQIEAAYRY